MNGKKAKMLRKKAKEMAGEARVEYSPKTVFRSAIDGIKIPRTIVFLNLFCTRYTYQKLKKQYKQNLRGVA